MDVRPATIADLDGIAAIENREIATGFAHFGMTPITAGELAEDFREAGDRYPWLVAVDESGVLGFARCKPWRARAAYAHSVEIGIYVRHDQQGRGIGRALYDLLFQMLREREFVTVLAGITLPNPASIRLHESFGMQKVANFPRVGYKMDAWRDVGYWCRHLDESPE